MLSLSCLLAFDPGPGKSIGQWQTLKTNPEAAGRGECGMAACNGKLYLLGGEGEAAAVEVFDPTTARWTKKKVAPVDMNHFQPVAYQNKIYVLSAFSGGGFPEQGNLKNVYSYDTKNDTWEAGGALPEDRRRGSAGATVYNGKLYLVNGIKHGHSSGTTNLFDVYDPATQQWSALPDAPHIRDHCAAAVVHDKLYVAGGRNTSYHEDGNYMSFFSKTVLDVDCYDFKTGSWSTLAAQLPLGSGGGSMVNLDGKLFYMGGERATATEQNQPRKNVYWLDPASNTPWQETDTLRNARNGMSAAALNHKIYVFGGGGPGGPGGPGQPGDAPIPQNGNPGNPPPQNDPGGQPGPPPGGGPGSPQGPSPLEVFSLR